MLLALPAPQAAGQAAQAPWPSFGHDAQHTGRSPYAGPDNPTILWQFTAEGGVSGPPVVAADGTVYFGATDDNLYALNPDGSEEWRYQTGGDILSSPALAPDGAIYVASRALYAISPAGALLWSLPISSGSTQSSPAVAADGTIYLGSSDDSLYAIDPSGRQEWRYETGRDIEGSPAIAPDGTIYFASGDAGRSGTSVVEPEYKVYALHPDGTLKWTYDARLDGASPAVGPDGTVYLGAYGNALIALRPDDTRRWSYATTDRVETTPAIGADGTVYITSRDGVLYAINGQGRHDWLERTGGGLPTAPAVDAAGVIWVGSSASSRAVNSRLTAFNSDGSVRSTFDLKEPFRWAQTSVRWGFTSPPVPGADGVIYIGATDNRLLALGQGSAAAGLPVLLYIGIGLGILVLAGLSFPLWRRLRRPAAARDGDQRRWAGLAPGAGTRKLLADGAPAKRSALVRALAAIPNPLAPRITLAVEADKQDLAYGDRLGVSVTVRASRKSTLRRLAVEMVYAGEHRRTVTAPVVIPTGVVAPTGRGGRLIPASLRTIGVDEATFTGEHLHNAQVLGENMAVSWMTDTLRAYFDIGADTPPTYRGMRMDLTWTVRAVAHPAWGRTVRSLPVRLTLPAAPAAATADAPRSSSTTSDKYDLELSLPRSRLVAGDVLSAMVEVTPHTRFTAERIEAMLAWSEGLVMTRFSRSQEVELRRDIAGKTDFKEGAARQFSVELKIPLTATSSVESPLPLLFWVLRVSLWRDQNSVQDVELPVYIWNPNPAAVPEAAPARGRRRGRSNGRKAEHRPDGTRRSHSASVG